jgi:hypothetical protein
MYLCGATSLARPILRYSEPGCMTMTELGVVLSGWKNTGVREK